MGLTSHYQYKGSIDVLSSRFALLRNRQIRNWDQYRWHVSPSSSFDGLEEIYSLSAMVIGKTGYGKSTLLNTIIGQQIFRTDDTECCTKDLYEALFRLGSRPQYYLSLHDMPSIGEGEQVDKQYMDWYRQMVEHSACVVYVLRANQRDYSIDLSTFQTLFPYAANCSKIMIAVNFADKIEPLSRTATLSAAQENALLIKCESIASLFAIRRSCIIPCSAHTGYGIDRLTEQIVSNLSRDVYGI